jgi:microcin C transport system substrate-binding protein
MTSHKVTRRELLLTGAAAAGSALLRDVAAAESAERHGISAYGDLGYPADFGHFKYVNPNAPKGGIFSHVASGAILNQSPLTFNSLNIYILKGDGAQGMQHTFASLMARALDESDALYGLAARSVRISDDGLTYRFLLRNGLTFHDGSPLAATDVAFSLKLLKTKGHPIMQLFLRDFRDAEATDETTLVVRFAENKTRDAALFVASLPIFSQKYYASHSFEETTLQPPLGSGPYKVGRFDAGRFIEYERVKNWWGVDLPVARGQNNFDVLRYEFYRDRDLAFQGFAAKNYLFREEFTSRIWSSGYDFPAVHDGRVKRDVLPDDSPTTFQGWFFNTRREAFKDKRLREAFISAFDFEWTNKTIMYGAYSRTSSIFQNSDMMAVGRPGPDELALLEPFRGRVSDEVFGEAVTPEVTDGSGQDRSLLRKASALLSEGGCAVVDGKRHLPEGKPVTVEFLLDEPGAQAIHMPFIKNLNTLGIEATVRIVDPIQYRARLETFDFDIVVQRLGFSSVPGTLLRNYFSSQTANVRGSQNLCGIADPVIDALIDRIVVAETRSSLVTACRALDRVMRSGRYWIPHWYKGVHWLAYWDVFSRPETKPRYARGAPETWWYDQEKAAKIDQRG